MRQHPSHTTRDVSNVPNWNRASVFVLPRKIHRLTLVFVALNVTDLLSTGVAIAQLGGYERAPIATLAMRLGGVWLGLLVLKSAAMIVTATSIGALVRWGYPKLAVRAFALVDLFYCEVVINNLLSLLRR